MSRPIKFKAWHKEHYEEDLKEGTIEYAMYQDLARQLALPKVDR